MEKLETEVEPAEGRRTHTTLNLKANDVDQLTEIAESRNMTKTEVMDLVVEIGLSQLNNTSQIDQMIATSTGFWWTDRDLEKCKAVIPPETAKKLSPSQRVHLYSKLKDTKDRQRTFEALGLVQDLDDFDAVNAVLEKASNIKDGKLVGYNLKRIANETRAKLSFLQQDYLSLKLGAEALKKLKAHIPEKFPTSNIFEEKKPSSANPTLETVLAVVQVSEQAWKVLPETVRKQVHEAVAKGQLELARGLIAGAKAVAGK